MSGMKRADASQTPTAPRAVGGTATATAAIVVSTLLWGTFWIPLRQLHQGGVDGLRATSLGFVLPLLVLLPHGLRQRRRIAAGGRALLTGGFLLALAIALYTSALLRGNVARVMLLFYLTPVWSTLLARASLGEPIRRGRIAGIILGLTGLAVVLGDRTGLPLPHSDAEWMGLLSGFCWALAMLVARRTHEAQDLDKVFVQFLFLGALFLAVSLLLGVPQSTPAPFGTRSTSLLWLPAFALGWVLPVLWLTIYGGSRLDPGRVAMLLMLEVVVGLVSAATLTHEPFGMRELTGAVLIVLAGGVEVLAPLARHRFASNVAEDS